MGPGTQTVTKALKEWAALIRVLDLGEQVLLLRKGGIAEKTGEFVTEHRRFLLYPTYEHQKASDVKPAYQALFQATQSPPVALAAGMLAITNWAEVVDDIIVKDTEKVRTLSPFHIWTEPFIEMRLAYKPEIPLHVLLVRVHRLPEPAKINVTPAYAGCRSWVTLDTPVSLAGSSPVQTASEQDEKFQAIRAILNPLEGTTK